MSSRQPAKVSTIRAPVEMAILFFNFGHLFGVEFLQELPRLDEIEFRIVGLDAKEKAVDGGAFGKRRYVENRMIRHREFVHRKHPDHGTERCQKHRTFESNGYISRPTIEWASTDVVRISDHCHPPQQREATDAARQAAGQDNCRDPVAREADRFSQALDRHGRVGVHLSITRRVGAVGGLEQMLGLFELSHEAVYAVPIPKRFVHINPRVPVWANPLICGEPDDAAPHALRRSRLRAGCERIEPSASGRSRWYPPTPPSPIESDSTCPRKMARSHGPSW